MTHSTPNQGVFKAPESPTEAYLKEIHGDLHDVIPTLLTNMSQRQAALCLSDKNISVSQAWVSNWLRDNGYNRVTRWVRKGQAS